MNKNFQLQRLFGIQHQANSDIGKINTGRLTHWVYIVLTPKSHATGRRGGGITPIIIRDQ